MLYPELDKVLSCMVAKRPLHEYGMKAEECELFADSVLATQQRLLNNNYVPLSREEILNVYKQLFWVGSRFIVQGFVLPESLKQSGATFNKGPAFFSVIS